MSDFENPSAPRQNAAIEEQDFKFPQGLAKFLQDIEDPILGAAFIFRSTPKTKDYNFNGIPQGPERANLEKLLKDLHIAKAEFAISGVSEEEARTNYLNAYYSYITKHQ